MSRLPCVSIPRRSWCSVLVFQAPRFVLFCCSFCIYFWACLLSLKKKKIFFVFLTQLSAQLPEVKAAVG